MWYEVAEKNYSDKAVLAAANLFYPFKQAGSDGSQIDGFKLDNPFNELGWLRMGLLYYTWARIGYKNLTVSAIAKEYQKK